MRLYRILLCFCMILSSFIDFGTVGKAFANEGKQRSLVKTFDIWEEDDQLRIQLELSNKFEQTEVLINSQDETQQITYANDSRISISAKGVTWSSPTFLQIKGYSDDELTRSAFYRITLSEPTSLERVREKSSLRMKKSKWDTKAKSNGYEIERLADEEVKTQAWLDKEADKVSRKKKATTVTTASTTFEIEPNDIMTKADWTQSDKDAFGKIQKAGDKDYWKFKPKANAEARIQLMQIPSSQDYDIVLYDSEGKELASSQKSGSIDEYLEWIGVEKDNWYYIAVRGKADHFDKSKYYLLKVSYTVTGNNLKPDEYEPNNSFQGSTEIASGQLRKGNIHQVDDVDYFKIDVLLSSTMDLSLSGLPEGIDIDLYLYDKSNKLVARSENSKNKPEQISFNGDAGRYYIKVAMSKRSELKEHTYQLTVQVNTMPVILVPGIGGSRLMADEILTLGDIQLGKKTFEAWLNLGQTVLNPTDSVHRKALTLQPKAPNNEKVEQKNKEVTVYPKPDENGFNAIAYLSDNFAAKDQTEQYHSMIEHLEKMGYQKGKSLFAYPYDWRLSNSESSKGLQKKIDEALVGSKAKQVQLVVHSMGGLVARDVLLSNSSYQKKTKRVIYMGTPFLGAPKGYEAIKFGYNFGISWGFYDLLERETGRIIAEYSPAVYELLPSKVYVSKQTYLNLVIDGGSRPFTYDEILKDNRIKLDYQPLVKLAERQHGKWDNKQLSIPQYQIIGDGQLTLMGYDLDQLGQRQAPFFNTSGDGTVPVVSSSHDTGNKKTKKYYIADEHAALPRNPYVIQQVAHLLLGIEDVQTGMRTKSKESTANSYYLIYRKDGMFPEVSLQVDGETIHLSSSSRGIKLPKNLILEKHGNILMVSLRSKNSTLHITSDQKLRLPTYEDGIVIEEYAFDGRNENRKTQEYDLLPNQKIKLRSGE